MIEIALPAGYPPNAATIIRMAACFGIKVRIIEPAGFAWSKPSVKRAGMDYLDRAQVIRHASWATFREATRGQRLILASTKANLPYTEFAFRPGDILIMGRETPACRARYMNGRARLVIPMRGACARSMSPSPAPWSRAKRSARPAASPAPHSAS